MKNTDLGCLVKIAAFFVLFFGLFAGNVFLISGQGDEFPLCVFMGIICDIVIGVYFVRIIYNNQEQRILQKHRQKAKLAIQSELEYCTTTCKQVKHISDETRAVYAIVKLVTLCDEENNLNLENGYSTFQERKNGQFYRELKQKTPQYELDAFPSSIIAIPSYYNQLNRRIPLLEQDLKKLRSVPDEDIDEIWQKYQYIYEDERSNIRKRIKKFLLISGIAVLTIVTVLIVLFMIVPKVKLNNANKLLESGQYDEAIALYKSVERFVSVNSNEVTEGINECLYHKASAAAAVGEYESALSSINSIDDAFAEKDSVTSLKSECYCAIAKEDMENGNYKEAINEFVMAGAYINKDAFSDCMDKYTEKQVSEGNLMSGVKWLETIVAEHHDNKTVVAECYYQIACLHLAAGASENADKALANIPNYRNSSRTIDKYYLQYVKELVESGYYTTALQYLDRITATDNNKREINTLRIECENKSSSVKKTSDTVDTIGYISANSVNLRKGPNTSSTILGEYPRSTSLTIVSESGEWYQVKIGNITGYMKKEFIGTGSSEKNEERTEITNKTLEGTWTAYYNEDGVFCRSLTFSGNTFSMSDEYDDPRYTGTYTISGTSLRIKGKSYYNGVNSYSATWKIYHFDGNSFDLNTLSETFYKGSGQTRIIGASQRANADQQYITETPMPMATSTPTGYSVAPIESAAYASPSPEIVFQSQTLSAADVLNNAMIELCQEKIDEYQKIIDENNAFISNCDVPSQIAICNDNINEAKRLIELWKKEMTAYQ